MILMNQKAYLDINMNEEIFCIIPTNWVGFHPSDGDIDKTYRIPKERDNSSEAIAYRRVRSIANYDADKVNWAVAIELVTRDIHTISNCIRHNKLKYPEELEEFVINVIAIYNYWDNQYREDFNLIKEYRDSVKKERSINDMTADELREYIRTHNIK